MCPVSGGCFMSLSAVNARTRSQFRSLTLAPGHGHREWLVLSYANFNSSIEAIVRGAFARLLELPLLLRAIQIEPLELSIPYEGFWRKLVKRSSVDNRPFM